MGSTLQTFCQPPEDRRPLVAEAPKPGAKVQFAVDAQLAVLGDKMDLQGLLCAQKELRARAKMGEEPGYSRDDPDQQPTEEEEAAALKKQAGRGRGKGGGRGRGRGPSRGKVQGRGSKGGGNGGCNQSAEVSRDDDNIKASEELPRPLGCKEF